MSQENLELVQRAFAEFERGNFWVPEIFDPDVRVVWLAPLVGAAVGEEDETVGLAGMTRSMKEWLDSFEEVTMVPERFADAGDRVVVIAEWRGRGKASGAVAKWRYGAVWTIRDGKVIDLVTYTDPAAALEAVGLSDQGQAAPISENPKSPP